MAGPSFHKGSCTDPAARGPQDHIKLDLVPVSLPTKELRATKPKTVVLVCHLEHVRCETSMCGGGPPGKVVTAFSAEMVRLKECTFKEPKCKHPNARGHSWPRLTQRPRSSRMEHKRFQLGLSTPKLGAGVSGSGFRSQLEPAVWERRKGGWTKALSHLDRDEPRRPRVIHLFPVPGNAQKDLI